MVAMTAAKSVVAVWLVPFTACTLHDFAIYSMLLSHVELTMTMVMSVNHDSTHSNCFWIY